MLFRGLAGFARNARVASYAVFAPDLTATVGYACVALDLFVPTGCFSPDSLRRFHPVRDGRPPWSELDQRTPERKRRKLETPAADDAEVLQLSRVTFVLDDSCNNGKGNGLAFVRRMARPLALFVAHCVLQAM